MAAEDRGFDSLWVPEHTHIPTSRRTPPPTGEDELHEDYSARSTRWSRSPPPRRCTSRIHLGTGILLPAQRDPIVTAKAIATLQNLSGGRFELGSASAGTRRRWRTTACATGSDGRSPAEHVRAMQALWHDEVAEFHGEHVELPPCWSWPKPEVPVPVLIGGGAGPTMFAHLGEYADGWIPIGGSGLADAIPRYRAALEAAGRDPSPRAIVPFGSLPTPGKLEHFADIGVSECVLPGSPAPRWRRVSPCWTRSPPTRRLLGRVAPAARCRRATGELSPARSRRRLSTCLRVIAPGPPAGHGHRSTAWAHMRCARSTPRRPRQAHGS